MHAKFWNAVILLLIGILHGWGNLFLHINNTFAIFVRLEGERRLGLVFQLLSSAIEGLSINLFFEQHRHPRRFWALPCVDWAINVRFCLLSSLWLITSIPYNRLGNLSNHGKGTLIIIHFYPHETYLFEKFASKNIFLILQSDIQDQQKTERERGGG